MKASEWVEDACRHRRIPVHTCIVPQVCISAWLPFQPCGRAKICCAPASPPTPCQPHTKLTKNEHVYLQKRLKADEFFLLPVVTCKGRLWARPANASFAHQIPTLSLPNFVLVSCHGEKSHPLFRASAIAADEGQLLSKMDWFVLSCC